MFDPVEVDGVWSIWYKWSQCTVTCGTGRAVRNRTCRFYTRYPDTPHGDDCDGEHAEAKDCNTQLCPGKQYMHDLLVYSEGLKYS